MLAAENTGPEPPVAAAPWGAAADPEGRGDTTQRVRGPRRGGLVATGVVATALVAAAALAVRATRPSGGPGGIVAASAPGPPAAPDAARATVPRGAAPAVEAGPSLEDLERAAVARRQADAAWGLPAGSARRAVPAALRPAGPPGPPVVADPDAIGRPLPPGPGPAEVVEEVDGADRARARALNARGLAMYRRGRHEDALDLYDDALEADPTYPWAHYNMACMLARRADADGAIEHLLLWRDLSPTPPDIQDKVSRDPDFDPIRGDPGFREWLAALARPEDAAAAAPSNPLARRGGPR